MLSVALATPVSTHAAPGAQAGARAASATTTSIWSTAAPKAKSLATTGTITVGTRFKVTQTGSVTGLRLFQAGRSGGGYVGKLWTADGKQLAKVSFAKGGRGWRQASLGQPVQLTAGGTYVVGYVAKGGRAARAAGYFASGRVKTKGPLTALGGMRRSGNRFPAHGGELRRRSSPTSSIPSRRR